MSGRFPDSTDIHHLRDNLFDKVDMVTADHRRWKPTHPEIPQRTGKIFNAEKVDAGFFGIPQKHANNMDPMSRIILEVVYEAILDAGYHPLDFEGTNTGVFIATLYSETEKMTYFNNIIGTDTITGCQRSMTAKRISYFLKLKGVSFVTDTACSSSLVALEHAYKHLKAGLCERAIVCGIQLCLHESNSLQYARLGVLSFDGSCKVFDDAANGFARAEALVSIILEKLNRAKRTYAEIMHCKVNCDGYKEQGITFPSTKMQRILLEEFYKECEVDPSSLTYVEAHGTGTKIGDREELTTMDDFFCKRRNTPLYIGSTKSNMGHTESTAGLSSLVKILIGFECGFIPPNIHYTTPRTGLEALQKGRIIVVTEKMPWPDERGIVGVNSYGFGGVNAHLLLRWNLKLKINNGIPEDNSPRLVCASGRTEMAVGAILAQAAEVDVEYISLIHQIFGRVIPNQLYNGYIIVSKLGKIQDVICKNRTFGTKLRIIFTNVDQEWFHLGEKLMEFPPFFDCVQSLKWVEGPLSMKSVPDADQELVHIHFSSINFKDIMMASGRIAIDVLARDTNLEERMQGLEFSGALAHDSTKRVMGVISSGALSTMVMADSQLLWPFPDQWSLEDAATVPLVYSTVLYGFLMRARIKRGQSMLIHSGTGGIGQAAINVATHIGCTIFTTVSSRKKREFIKKNFPHIKDKHIGDSRSTSFEQMVLENTEGKGVDLVLNSLAEEKLLASIRCLAYNGVFLEIGRFDLERDNQLWTALLRKQGRFEGITLDWLFVGMQETKEVLWKYVKEGISNGSVKPLVRTIFSREEVGDAFRYMTTGNHIGKVLIKVRNEQHGSQYQLFSGVPRFLSKFSACYVIIGGLGGIGLELSDWLITRGAKQLVLTSRTGVKNSYQAHRLNVFKSYGIKVCIRSDDISTEEGCIALLSFAESLSPVEGIFNLAVILKDAVFENQTVETFKVSLKPKAYATRHLDTVSRKMCSNLRHFVVFSSGACGRGNPGQTNYGMANSVMERICEKRKVDGYPATAIQWGAIGEVGVVADMQKNPEELVMGTLQQKVSSCLQTLDQLLMQDEPIVSSMVIPEKKIKSRSGNIIEAVLNIIGLTNLKRVNIHTTFPKLGMDSIMAVEIKQTLEREYEVFLTTQDIRNMTISKLKSLDIEQDLPTSRPVQNKLETDATDMKLLLRCIGDEETSNKPFVQIKSKHVSYGKSVVFALAGIEGMASVFEFVGKQLDSTLICLQFCANNHSDSIEEIVKPLVKIVASSTSTDFTIIAYSFGCVVAIELMYALESQGKVGKAFFIDGAPEILVHLVKLYCPTHDDEVLQTELLCILMTRYLPFNFITNHKENIMKQQTYKDKVKYVLNISPNINPSEKYFVDIYTAMLCRVRAARKYERRIEKLKSMITLAKPTKQITTDIAQDYNLSSITEQHVDVKIIEGDHASILNQRQLVEEIQLFLDTER